MAFIKKLANGEFYIGITPRSGRPYNHKFSIGRYWWLGKQIIYFGQIIYIPKELWGKRLMFKVEVIEDELDKNIG